MPRENLNSYNIFFYKKKRLLLSVLWRMKAKISETDKLLKIWGMPGNWPKIVTTNENKHKHIIKSKAWFYMRNRSRHIVRKMTNMAIQYQINYFDSKLQQKHIIKNIHPYTSKKKHRKLHAHQERRTHSCIFSQFLSKNVHTLNPTTGKCIIS